MKSIITLLVTSLMIIAIINSCKETDDRDKFVGTWTGLMMFSRIGYEFPTTVIISKSSTNSSQIVFEESGSAPRTATVTGNSYTYIDFKDSYQTYQDEVSGNFAGKGAINGDILNESGTITSDNPPFPADLGTWNRHLARQK